MEGPGGLPKTLRAWRSGGGGQEGSQTHSELGGAVEGGQEGSQTHSESGRSGGGLHHYYIITVSEP